MKELVLVDSAQENICNALDEIGKDKKLYHTVPFLDDHSSKLSADKWDWATMAQTGSFRFAGMSEKTFATLSSDETEKLYVQQIRQAFVQSIQACPNVEIVSHLLMSSIINRGVEDTAGFDTPTRPTEPGIINRVTGIEAHLSLPFDTVTLQSRILDPHDENTVIRSELGQLLFFNRDKVKAAGPYDI